MPLRHEQNERHRAWISDAFKVCPVAFLADHRVQRVLAEQRSRLCAGITMVLIAVVSCALEPVGQNRMVTSPFRPSSDRSAQPELRVGHNCPNQYSKTTRIRKTRCGRHERRRFVVIEQQPLRSVTKSLAIAGNNRQSLQLYLSMDGPGTSPGRWRC
jgi:hypothetical protein